MTEAQVRTLRNRVFDHIISDLGWSSVRENWMTKTKTEWLKEHDFPLATPHSQEWLAEHQPYSTT